jgi:uncharacterized protein YbaP (TraB family)
LRQCERMLSTPPLPISKKAKRKYTTEAEGLRARLKELDTQLTDMGAQPLLTVQDQATALNASLADAGNRRMTRYYEETGLDLSTAISFMPAALFRFVVDFIIPIGTAVYAIICMLRGR